MKLKKMISTVLISTLATSLFKIHVSAETTLEQVQCVMPEIHVYLHNDNNEQDITVSSVQAFLDNEDLKVHDTYKFSDYTDPIHYYIVLDNTGSVPASYVEPMKNAVQNIKNSLRDIDQLSVYTIGDGVNVLYEGNTDLNEALSTLSVTGMETYLYQSFVQISNTIENQSTEKIERNVVIAITDGVNETIGQAVYDEAKSKLEDQWIPVYAIGIGTNNSGLDSLGEISRKTNGQISLVTQDTLSDTVADIVNDMMDDYVISLSASNNIIGSDRELLLKIESLGYIKSLSIHPVRWFADTTAPKVLSVNKVSDYEVEIVYDEDIIGGSDKSNFQLYKEDVPIKISAAYYQNKDEFKTIIKCENQLYKGNYKLQLSNITDNTQEKNKLSDVEFLDLDWDGTIETQISKNDSSANNYQSLIFIISFCLLLMVIIVILVLTQRKKKMVVTQNGEVEYVDELKTEVHIKAAQKESISLHFEIFVNHQVVTEFDTDLYDTLIIGRSSSAQVRFDDPYMARTQFQITFKEGYMWLEDLGGENGTNVNGVPLNKGKQVCLRPGDHIIAGKTEMSVRW